MKKLRPHAHRCRPRQRRRCRPSPPSPARTARSSPATTPRAPCASSTARPALRACAANETPLKFNQRGPVGAQGPTGPKGPPAPRAPRRRDRGGRRAGPGRPVVRVGALPVREVPADVRLQDRRHDRAPQGPLPRVRQDDGLHAGVPGPRVWTVMTCRLVHIGPNGTDVLDVAQTDVSDNGPERAMLNTRGPDGAKRQRRGAAPAVPRRRRVLLASSPSCSTSSSSPSWSAATTATAPSPAPLRAPSTACRSRGSAGGRSRSPGRAARVRVSA